MALPRLRADLSDPRRVARLLRGALRHESAIVPLAAPPAIAGQHLLEIDVPGEGLVTILAECAAGETVDGWPLDVRPVTRPQMAALLAMIERLDQEPSNTAPPPASEAPGDPVGPGGPASGPPSSEDRGDRTLVDPTRMFTEYAPSDPPVALQRAKSHGPSLGGPEIALADPPAFDGFELSLPIPVPSAGGGGLPSSLAPAPPSMPPSMPPSSHGDVLERVIAGKYRIEALIGSGATAAVYRATHIDLRRPFAVKILHAANRGEMQFVKRFKGEALAASKLEHLNVARVIDYGQERDGLLYLVMELLTGKSLEAVLAASGGRLPQRKALDVAIQTCAALAFAHDEGIIHRDVKPENIVLVPHKDDDGNPFDLVKVCDFGMAKLREVDPEQGELTVAGMLCGSPAYMSPEQTRGDRLDARTDVYSLGVTLYETLTGNLPHDADTIASLFAKKLTEPPRAPSSYAGVEVDALVEDVVLRALEPDARSRHPSARAFREELRAALAQLDDELGEIREQTIIAE
jgi:serine/threonine-protein kinase